MAVPKSLAVIMAGGSGTRFWPLSQPDYPKQFLSLTGKKSLIAETAERILPLVGKGNLAVVSVEAQQALIRKELPEVSRLILEPLGRNTAPCLMLTAYTLLKEGVSGDTVLVVLPADHHIENRKAFEQLLGSAISFAAEKDSLVTLGIVPTSAHTGYGYIEAEPGKGPSLKVKRFVEKPDRKRAEEFLAAKNFYWNSGMFVWRLDSLVRAFERYCTADWKTLNAEGPSAYSKLTAQPIDVAVMEKADNLYLFPADIGWSDIGSWNAVYELKGQAPSNLVMSGDVHSISSQGCLVHLSSGKSVALIGVKDLIVVEKDGQLLIAHRDQDQLVRDAAKAFETRRPQR